jgi:hypothetical protein
VEILRQAQNDRNEGLRMTYSEGIEMIGGINDAPNGQNM